VFTPRKKEKNKMKTIKNIRQTGFTLVEIMIVVAIIGLLAAIAIPNFVRARATAQTNACINNLRIIDAAMNQYALEAGKKTGDAIPTPTTTLLVYIGRQTSQFPSCPLSPNGTPAYATIDTVGTSPTCPNQDPTNHNAYLK
jgi:prepilin-type N-terminal cleavage/methylation domain-containing protein